VELRKPDNTILAPHNGGATWDVRGARVASVARGNRGNAQWQTRPPAC
jgi:hypothetical protein